MPNIRVDIETLLRDDGISQLRAKLRELQALQKEISSTAFDPFSRAQAERGIAGIQAQKAAILEQEASIRVLNSTIQGSVGNLQSFINTNMGVDRTIKSAASSARTLSSSLGALAADDARARDASIAHTQARERATAAWKADVAARQAAEATRRSQSSAELTAALANFDPTAASARTARAVARQQDPEHVANQIRNLEAVLNNFKRSNVAGAEGSNTVIASLNKQLVDAQNNYRRLTGARLESERDAISRAGSRSSYISVESTKDAISAMDSLASRTVSTTQRQKELQAAFGPLIAAQDAVVARERAALEPFRQMTATLRGHESAAHGSARGFRAMSEETDRAAYANRKLITIFDEFSRGQRGQLMSTIGSIFRDQGFGGGAAFAGLGAVAGIAATAGITEKLAAWSSQLGELAVHQENMAAATGMSTDAFITFSTAVELAGGKADTAGRALEAMQGRMEEAVLNPTGQVAQAFDKLGLTWDELRKRLADPAGARETLLDLADAFARMGKTAEQTRLFTQISGGMRQFAEMVPILRQGRPGIANLEEESDTLNSALHRNHDALVKMEDRTKKLGTAWEGFKASLLGTDGLLGGVTTEITTLLTNLQNYSETFNKTGLAYGLNMMGLRSNTSTPVASAGIQGERLFDPLNKLSTVAPELAEALREATKALPAGYTARVTTGHADTGHKPDSEHKSDTGAIDYTIYDAAGTAITHKAAQVAGSEAAKVYHDLEYRFKQLTPGVGRAGVDFAETDPGHVDLGLMHGKAPGRSAEPAGSAPPVDYDYAAAEKLYLARLKYAQESARLPGQEKILQSILQEEAEFMAKGPTQRNEWLKKNIDLGRADAGNQAQLLGVYGQQWNLQKQLTAETQQARLAVIDKQMVEARGREDAAKVLELEREREKIVKSSAYTTRAESTRAEAQTLQANIALQKQKLQLLEQEAAATEKANSSILRGFEAQMQSRVDKREISPQQGYGFDIQQVYILAQGEKSALDNAMKLADSMKDAVAQTKIYWQEWELGVRTQEKVLELTKKIDDENKKAAEASGRAWKNFFDSAGGAFESYIDAAVSRTETFQKATQQLFQSLAKDLVKFLGGLASQYLAKQLAGSLGESVKPGEGIGGLLGNAIGRKLGFGESVAKSGTDAALNAQFTSGAANMQAFNAAVLQATASLGGKVAAQGADTAATTTGAAAKTTDTTATALNSTGKTLNSAAFTIDTSAVQTNAAAQAASAAGGGIGGLLKGLPIIGTVASLFFEQGGIVPSAAGGMVVGGSGTMSILHPREMVLPAHLSTGLQNMIERGDSGGGGGNSSTFNYNANVTGYHPYESRSGFESMLRTHGGSLRNWAEGIIRNQG